MKIHETFGGACDNEGKWVNKQLKGKVITGYEWIYIMSRENEYRC